MNESSDHQKELIFYYSHENCPARATAAPVLAWLAERKNIDFDGYFCVRPSVADIGDYLPFTGNKHDEQFYFLTNFYDHIYFTALSEQAPIQFERFLKAKNKSTIIKKSSQDLIDFYLDIFDLFDEIFPNEAIIFPSTVFPFPNEKIELGEFKIPGESRLDTFCYPEVFFRNALALHYELPDDQLNRLIVLGITKIRLMFCPKEAKSRFEKMGFDVEEIDTIQPEDNYCTITTRIAERWLSEVKGLAMGNDPITLRWTPKYLRERILPVAAVQSLPQAVEVLGRLSEQIGNKVVWGSQVFNDHIIADTSKQDIVLSLVHDVEVGITIRDHIKFPNLWLKNITPIWENENSDIYLENQLDAGKIPVCFMQYASDLGHLPVLPRYLDLHSIEGIVDGIAFPASWWQYAEEQVEQLYLAKEMGGVYPTAEPLLCSAGIGVATEAQGYLTAETYLKSLLKAKEIIAAYAGENHVPVGHYSFQDSCPKYQHNTAEPQYDVLIEAGLQYAITYKNEGKFPEIVYSTDDFTVLNQQTMHWTFNPLIDLREWERKLVNAGRHGWIIIGLDSPFWGMVPCYFGLASKGLSLKALQEAMIYARGGGESNQLFLAKPHEVVRFAHMLKGRNLI